MAAVDYFLKLDGIKGESTDDKHKDEIDVLSFSWGATQTGTIARGGGGAGAGKVSMQDFKFTMRVNKASASLFLACASGQHIKSATVIGRSTSGPVVEIASSALAVAQENAGDFLKLSFSDILVSSYQEGGSGADVFDNAALRYATVKYEGVPGARVPVRPESTGMITFDPKTGEVLLIESQEGPLSSGPGDELGGFTRGVAEYSLKDIAGILNGPGPCALTLSVREVRQPTDTTGGAPPEGQDDVRRDPPGPAKKLGRHDLYWYAADLELTAEDFSRKGRRLGSIQVDPSDPNAAATSIDLCEIVKENALDAIGIRIQSAMDHTAPSDEEEEGREEGSDSQSGPPFLIRPALFLVDLTLEMQ